MGGASQAGTGSARVARLLRATALSCLFAGALVPASLAQSLVDLAPSVPADSQMLLEADTLIYDNNDDTVTASGGVRIDYGGNRLVAERVTYDRASRRLIAAGGVQIVDQDGNIVHSDRIDVTDDFGTGFVNALRVETVDRTWFAAESAERRAGFLTTFNNGVYTACEPCEDQPDKAPVWRIKAKRIIWNSQTKKVRFEDPAFEFLGVRLGVLPSFEIADPTIRRKSGFLIPTASYDSDLGFGLSVPYYLALSPTYDLTLTGTGYTRQGFLGKAEWRQRFDNGQYSITAAGIRQMNPGDFDFNTVDSGRPGDPNRLRGMMGTKGLFAINSRWDFGWDVLVQSDKNFAKTYDIEGYKESIHRSEIFLTGLGDRNFFDLRAMHFEVQEDVFSSDPASRSEKQPWVLPSLDYSYVAPEPVFGGELNIDLNARVIRRGQLDVVYASDFPFPEERVRGIEGTSSRLTAEAEWKRSFVTDGGLVVTPMLAFQGDTVNIDQSAASVAAINAMAMNPAINAQTDMRSAYQRFMATLGLEVRFPLLLSSVSGSHVLEPTAQIFARPNEPFADTLGIPNEDAQSFVFDASTLFERDKFSGYDRIEGGTRANLGLRYSGSFANGWTTQGLVGQSYHLAGDNSFASPDLVNVGAYSGLESDTSDFVGMFGFASPFGLSASVSARLDEQTLAVRRSEFKVGYVTDALSVTAKYAYAAAQPLYGYDDDRQELSLGASTRFNDFWRVFGSGTYDVEKNLVVKNSLGFAYDDDCFSYLMSYSETRDRDTRDTSRTVGFRISFRTLGDFGSARDTSRDL